MEQEAQPGRGWRDLLWKEATNASCRILDTKAGPLFLHDHCPAGVVERLSAGSGLHAFAHLPEREYQLLLALAKRRDTKLTLAYTPGREIVGQVTLVPAAGWWQGLEFTYEMSLEVSSSWRRMGVARQLVTGALQDEAVEELIILGLGLRWHWDTEGLGLNPLRYRTLLARAAAAYGFSEYLTGESNISADPTNILLARIGSGVNQQRINQFVDRLLHSDTLPGLSSSGWIEEEHEAC
jgi:GNAT superfamily N-acetyltransferase